MFKTVMFHQCCSRLFQQVATTLFVYQDAITLLEQYCCNLMPEQWLLQPDNNIVTTLNNEQCCNQLLRFWPCSNVAGFALLFSSWNSKWSSYGALSQTVLFKHAEDVYEALAMAILTNPGFAHQATATAISEPAQASDPKLERPKVGVGVSVEEWNVFVGR